MNETFTPKKAIAIDFDGVIHKYSKGWYDGTIYDEPVEGSHEALMELKQQFNVFIHTTRNIEDVVNWMNSKFWGEGEKGFNTIPMYEGYKFWNGNFFGDIAVSNRKLPAVAYIDDRAIRFTNWKKIIEEGIPV